MNGQPTASSALIVQILSEKAKKDPTLQLHLEAAMWQAIAMDATKEGEPQKDEPHELEVIEGEGDGV